MELKKKHITSCQVGARHPSTDHKKVCQRCLHGGFAVHADITKPVNLWQRPDAIGECWRLRMSMKDENNGLVWSSQGHLRAHPTKLGQQVHVNPITIRGRCQVDS